MTKASVLVEQARQIAGQVTTWADLCNALYDPIEGILVRAYPDRAERQEFVKSDEFKQIRQLITEAMRRFGVIEGASPTRITEFMVQFHLTSLSDGSSGLKEPSPARK